MRWEDESYVRLYIRDTIDWKLLTWEARAILMFLLRKVDRAGVLELSRHGARGVAAVLEVPVDVIERALPELLEDGCLIERVGYLIIRNFVEAQSAKRSSRERVRLYRERKRARTRLMGILSEPEEDDGPDLPDCNADGNPEGNPSGNATSKRSVTSGNLNDGQRHYTLSLAKLSLDPPLREGGVPAPDGASLSEPAGEAVASPEPAAAEADAHREGPEPEPDSAPDGAFPWPPPPEPDPPKAKRKRRRKPAVDTTPGHKDFIDGFHALFVDHHGSKPTWGKVEGGMVKTLLGKHDATEALRRAAVMFGMAPRFPAEHPDLKTLVGHFDKFAGTDAPKVGASKITKQPEYSGGDVKF
jgi:hypothetical protein